MEQYFVQMKWVVYLGPLSTQQYMKAMYRPVLRMIVTQTELKTLHGEVQVDKFP